MTKDDDLKPGDKVRVVHLPDRYLSGGYFSPRGKFDLAIGEILTVQDSFIYHYRPSIGEVHLTFVSRGLSGSGHIPFEWVERVLFCTCDFESRLLSGCTCAASRKERE